MMFRLIVITFILLSLSACQSIKDPHVSQEKIFYPSQSHVNASPSQKILLIFKVDVEYPGLNEIILLSSSDRHVEHRYGSVAKAVVKALNAQGFQADYILHATEDPLDIASFNKGEYSHILVEELLSRHVYYGEYYDVNTGSTMPTISISYRKWLATLYTTIEKTPPKIIYEQRYISDGSDCFTIKLLDKKESCRNKLIDHILGPLALIGVQSDSIPPVIEQYK